jgi:hypothetical protein
VRTIAIAASLATGLLAQSAAAAPRSSTGKVGELLREIGQLSPAERAELSRAIRQRTATRTKAGASKAPVATGPQIPVTTPAAPQPKKSVAGLMLTPEVSFFVRHDFSDLGSLTKPIPTDQAQGAELSYSRDNRARNTIWATHALGAVVYSSYFDETPREMSLFKATVGGYVALDRTFNSNRKFVPDNSDVVSAGGLVELGVTRFLGGTHYFRVRGGFTSDEIAGTQQGNVTAEWFPIYPDLYFYRPAELFANIGVTFQPELIAQYNSTNDRERPLLFNGRLNSFRIGPQAALIFFPFNEDGSFLSRLSARVVYHWMYEAYSGRAFGSLITALTYNLTQDGTLAVSASYKRGREEETGKKQDLFRVSLTAKL